MPLDPDAQLICDMLAASGRPRLESLPPQEARAMYRAAGKLLWLDPPAVGHVRDLSAPGPAGAIGLRLYRGHGTGDERLPVLIFMHGGGFCVGDLDTHDHICCKLANGAGCAVVSIDYRLAPEHKFPAGLKDCAAAIRWVVENGESLSIDPARVAVGGDSSGGNLAAVMAHMARDGTLPAIRFQLLLYPTVDMGMRHPSHRQDFSAFPLTVDTVRYFRDHYVRECDHADWRASPLRAPDFKGLAPAYILTVGYDPLRDEGSDYARVLDNHGVPVELVHMNDQLHGFLTMGRVIRAADTALDHASSRLRAALHGK